MISTAGSRGGRALVETCALLKVRDLRGRYGFFASHNLTAADGTVIKFRIDVGEAYGWVHVEHWPVGADWAKSSYDIALISTPQPFGGRRWRFVCPDGFGPCGVLHLPTGADQFASRQVHGLAFASQRLRAPARAAVRAQRIRLNLGGSADLNAPFPERPRVCGRRPTEEGGMWGMKSEAQLR